ncbi:hypothetical protein SNE40_003386 [Patella caerulea]|uniref:Reverse transcriptase domain-containing protein n=1 Tax=Patella caerulea TaxID=87958 RepID=A0AAN8Q0U0_PATCE
MDTIQTIIDLIEPSCFMSSLDLKDAYHSVPIARNYRKYLKFQWNSKLYQFRVLPNGLASAPRYFTTLLKPIFAFLRQQALTSSGYILMMYF